jgi:hypothetical protein
MRQDFAGGLPIVECEADRDCFFIGEVAYEEGACECWGSRGGRGEG